MRHSVCSVPLRSTTKLKVVFVWHALSTPTLVLRVGLALLCVTVIPDTDTATITLITLVLCVLVGHIHAKTRRSMGLQGNIVSHVMELTQRVQRVATISQIVCVVGVSQVSIVLHVFWIRIKISRGMDPVLPVPKIPSQKRTKAPTLPIVSVSRDIPKSTPQHASHVQSVYTRTPHMTPFAAYALTL